MTRQILIAGVGNIFFGDDAFGVEVARRLSAETLPPGVSVADFGIRGVHLAYDLLSAPDLLIVADALPRGEAPGTLYVVEPQVDEAPPVSGDAHSMHLPSVFASVRAMGGSLPPIRIVGCEPLDVGERLGLSPPVQQAIEPTIALIRQLLDRELSGSASSATKEEKPWQLVS